MFVPVASTLMSFRSGNCAIVCAVMGVLLVTTIVAPLLRGTT